MNVEFKNVQSKGKTLSCVALVHYLTTRGGYSLEECAGNVCIDVKGYNFMSSDELAQLIHRVYVTERGKHLHKIFIFDEMDGYFSHRGDLKTQREMLQGCYQDEKMWHYLLFTTHEGLSVDKMIRDIRQIQVVPEFVEEEDWVYWTVFNGNFCEIFENGFRASLYYPFYNRWAVVN